MRRTLAFILALILMLGAMAPGAAMAEAVPTIEETRAAPQETAAATEAAAAVTEETAAAAPTAAVEETAATEAAEAAETEETRSPDVHKEQAEEPTEPVKTEDPKSLWEKLQALFGFSQEPGPLELMRLSDEKGEELFTDPSFDPSCYRYEAKVPAQGFRLEVAAYPDVQVYVGGVLMEDPYMDVAPEWNEEKKATLAIHLVAEGWDGEDYVLSLTQLPPEPVELEITQLPEKTEYLAGEVFDPAGLKVLLHYSDGSTAEINPAELTCVPQGPLTEEDTVITVFYGDLFRELEITVRGILPGEGTRESPYLLATEADLRMLDTWVTEEDSRAEKAYFRMENDIELTGTWGGIGDEDSPFTGDFDGDGYQITIPEGGKALFSRTRGAVIHDLKLYGPRIEDYGLVSHYVVDRGAEYYAQFYRVTIASGTQTLYSGFLGGYASGQDQVLIESCTVEAGVTIGYDKSQSHIGSFAGEFNGFVRNSESAAAVYGTTWVGGLVGNKGQSMGDFEVTDSSFSGTVSASGNYAGGIVGGGYAGTGWGIETAPNAKGVVIKGCICTGSVSGGNGVGGILGAEDCVQQFWDNGVGYIQNNRFTGSVSGTGYTGGIIGFMQSLNANMIISGNYYINASKGIGAVAHVDTSAVANGFREGTYYYNTSKYVSDGNGGVKSYEDEINTVALRQYIALPTIGKAATGNNRAVSKPDMNRSDDPLGVDQDKLCYTDGGAAPKIYATGMTLEGTPKTAYTQGDALSLAGLTLIVKWSDGSETRVPAENATVSGYNADTTGNQTVRLRYEGQEVRFTVTVTPKSMGITVSVTIMGDSHHSDPNANGGPHGLARGGLTTWASETLSANTTNTVWDVLQRVAASAGLRMDASSNNQYGTVYISGVNGLSEFDNGKNSGWMYTVNGTHPEVGVSAKYLKDGDKIIFHYTDDYTYEEGSDKYGSSTGDTGTAVSTANTEKQTVLISDEKIDETYHNTGDYMEKLGTPGVGPIGGEWMVIGLARSGRTVPGEEEYYQKALEYIKGSIDPKTGRLHRAKSTDNSRMILALTAIGKDATDIDGIDLLQGLSDLDFVKYQGNNGPIWALLALDCGNYPAPEGGTTTRQALIEELLSVQTSDGGWAITGDKADSDMTGMALTALAPYYEKNEKVRAAVDKAVARLSEMQDADGGFSTSYGDGKMVATSESISQVVTALSSLGIDADTDERFLKNGSSAIDALLRYSVKGGGFKHIMDGTVDGMGTEQAYYALTAYYRFLSGETSLYNMTDVIDKGGDPVVPEAEVTAPGTAERTKASSAKAEGTQFGCPWWVLAFCMFGGCGWGVALTLIVQKHQSKAKEKNGSKDPK